MARCLSLTVPLLCLLVLAACSGPDGALDPAGSVGTSPQALTLSPTPTQDLQEPPGVTPGAVTPSPTRKAPASTTPSAPAATRETRVVSADSPNDWVRDRIDVVVQLYDISEEGEQGLHRLDVRWMQDQPGFFGSFGFASWTGVGEARPRGVAHELGHAYWGMFPVTGFPELAWDTGTGGETSPAMRRYHSDLLAFMKQPPDPFEPLRRRLRTLPELSAENTEPLFHSMEADLVQTTAGDLNLVPPILRKYWNQFLRPGPFHSWDNALAWYQGEPSRDERAVADEYLGFQHFEPGGYESFMSPAGRVPRDGASTLLLQEEAQRLADFVQLFDQLIGAAPHREDFQFWRRYLRDKIDLHGRHPDLVASLGLPRSREIAAALNFFGANKDAGPNEEADLLAEELMVQPFLVHFLPALQNRTLLRLFTSGVALPEGSTLKGTSDFVRSLEVLAPDVNAVLEEGRSDVLAGASGLKSFLDNSALEDKEALRLFFELLQDTDDAIARSVVASLDDSTLIELLRAVPTKAYGLLAPSKMMAVLDITPQAPPAALARGIQLMLENPSGNFQIGRPFLDEMYQVVAARASIDSEATLEIIAGLFFPLERFIELHPAVAADLLAGNLDLASRIVEASDPVTFPPARVVYRLIYADPELAARLVRRLDSGGSHALVLEALAQIAYDVDRLQAVPVRPISLEMDGRFLKRLGDDLGYEWLESRLGQVIDLYRGRVDSSEVPQDFLQAYERTLLNAAATLEDPAASVLEEMTSRLFK